MSTENIQDETFDQTIPMADEPAGDETESAFVAETRTPISTTSLVMFAILLAGAAGIWFMHGRTRTKSAPTAESTAATATISQFLTNGGKDIRAMQEMLRNTQQVVAQFAAFPAATQVPLSDLRINPFRLGPLEPRVDENAEAEARKKREAERAAILKAVQGLRLETIMCGETRRACMINGDLCSEGQEVDGFVIEKIAPASVTVKNGQYRFELRMKR